MVAFVSFVLIRKRVYARAKNRQWLVNLTSFFELNTLSLGLLLSFTASQVHKVKSWVIKVLNIFFIFAALKHYGINCMRSWWVLVHLGLSYSSFILAFFHELICLLITAYDLLDNVLNENTCLKILSYVKLLLRVAQEIIYLFIVDLHIGHLNKSLLIFLL